jgi:hypothetical protein
MKHLSAILIILAFMPALSFSQPDSGYFLIYGNPDGSPLVVPLDSDIRVKMWVETPLDGDINGNGIVDSVAFMIDILASNDSFVVSRNGGRVYFPLTIWDDIDFIPEDPGGSLPGYTIESLIAFATGTQPILLNTEGQKVHIADFHMHTTSDSSYLYQTVSALATAVLSPTGDFTYWGLQDGVTDVIPEQIFSTLYFADYDYMAGDANDSGNVNGLDVLYLVNYLKQTGPPPDPLLGGDANGNCLVNGLDVIYLVNYFKGIGFPPQLGVCP